MGLTSQKPRGYLVNLSEFLESTLQSFRNPHKPMRQKEDAPPLRHARRLRELMQLPEAKRRTVFKNLDDLIRANSKTCFPLTAVHICTYTYTRRL